MDVLAMKNAYEKHRNLKLAANEIGMKWQTLYWNLKKNGIPVVGDKSKYGTEKDRFAAKAEQDFKNLVPDATNMNQLKFQSKYDFEVNGLKIDVKASNLNYGFKKSKCLRWAFSVRKQEMEADFIVGMAYKDGALHKLFLFPSEQVRFRQSITISENGSSKWHDFEISEGDLKTFFSKTIFT